MFALAVVIFLSVVPIRRTASTDEEGCFKFLRNVTLQQCWDELWVPVLVWALTSAFSVAVILLIEVSAPRIEINWPAVPRPVWPVAGIAAFTWIGRGVTIVLPRSFCLWLLMVLTVAAGIITSVVLQPLAMTPFFLGIAIARPAINRLAQVGKANHLAHFGSSADES